MLDRTVSDHCAIILKHKDIDWGPRPFRTLDVWITHVGFNDKVRTLWEQYKVSDNDIWVMKEKLK